MEADINNDPLTDSPAAAVEIIAAHKSYGSYNVLKNLSLLVPKGAIYGLLGPSGCGKTTILRAICSRVKMDDGEIRCFGHEPGSKESGIPGKIIGYMPQEIALYNEFTIDETLTYFGYLHNMSPAHLANRKEFLFSFLNLEEAKKRLVSVLSGGQKRRVSMMCALLQEPQLLILDEPTVGVDPLLREKIWDHLIKIASTSGTTIIITTHYIEEARKADRVGLMRNGRILAEDSPENLLNTFEESTLENVFLKLCLKDQIIPIAGTSNAAICSNEVQKNSINFDQEQNKMKAKRSCLKSIITTPKEEFKKAMRLPKWNNLKGLFFKNSLLMRRNIGFLVFEFLIPVIQISLFCTCIGREPYGLQFGIVNNETIYNSTSDSSLVFINELDNHTFSKKYMNWSDAYQHTKKGEIWGFFDISVNFTQDTQNKIFNPSNNDTNNGSFINLYMDTTSQQIALTIQAKAVMAYQNFLQIFLEPFGLNPTLFQTPIILQEPIYGQKDPQFVNFMVPGIMVTIVFSLSIGLTSLMFVLEKKDGLLDRSGIAGVTTLEIMIAHVLVKLTLLTVQIIILIGTAAFIFKVKILGPFILSALLLLLQGFCGMSYGLAISSLSDNEVQVLELAIATIFPSLLLSGIIWPVEGMPNWVRLLTNFSPLTHTAEAMRCVASRGWGITHFSVWFGLIAVSLWSMFFNLCAAVIFTFRQQ